MTFEDNKQFWEEFINLYKENVCLWDTKSKEYKNKQMKYAAYEKMVTKSKEIYPNADKELIMKKISSLRASFRRQTKRINEAKRSGCGTDDVPEITLWYFNLMTFLLDQEEPRASKSSIPKEVAEENENETQFTEIQDINEPRPNTPPRDLQSPETPQTSISSSCSNPRKRTKLSTETSWTKKRNEFIEAGIRALNEDPREEMDKAPELQEVTFGKNVGQQLQEVENRQKVIAQKLISDILFHAKLGNLTNSSSVTLVPQEIYGYQPTSFVHTEQLPQSSNNPNVTDFLTFHKQI